MRKGARPAGPAALGPTSAIGSGVRPAGCGESGQANHITGLRRDLDTAHAGLAMPFRSGPVEGHVNRIIM
ncbi:hypothetical protein E1295_12825 [Nonomuraea mesophila]|uniref:Uncharacterized protein n=1 Tax=Nonomuraea mesophila TaxID=2530382 RepID=A0A4R5FSP7_9ACTN|nr:hypothetical protein E1295_12825 [Nonomuraea mesophila]